MIRSGILNPHVLAMLARFRHTNLLVITDKGFPSWPTVPTVDLSLTDDIPCVLDVLRAITDCCDLGAAIMAEEFLSHNDEAAKAAVTATLGDTPLSFESHEGTFKPRVPGAIGLIRTAGTVAYSNIIIESA